MSDLFVNRRLTIPAAELKTSAVRSSGPGGQNVNKVNSKITLRWSPGGLRGDRHGLARPICGPTMPTESTETGSWCCTVIATATSQKILADVRFRLVQMLLECREPAKKRKADQADRRESAPASRGEDASK